MWQNAHSNAPNDSYQQSTITAEVCSRCRSVVMTLLVLLALLAFTRWPRVACTRRCFSGTRQLGDVAVNNQQQRCCCALALLQQDRVEETIYIVLIPIITKPGVLTSKVLFTGWKEAQVPWILDLCCWRHTTLNADSLQGASLYRLHTSISSSEQSHEYEFIRTYLVRWCGA